MERLQRGALYRQGPEGRQVDRGEQAAEGASRKAGSDRKHPRLPARQSTPHTRGVERQNRFLLGDDLPLPGQLPLRPLPRLVRRQVALGLPLARRRLERRRPRRGFRNVN